MYSPGKTDRKCAGYAGNHVLQGDCNARADDTKCDAEAAQAVFKENREEEEDCDVSGKDDELAGLITRITAAKAPWKRSLKHVKHRVNEENSNDCGNAFSEERK